MNKWIQRISVCEHAYFEKGESTLRGIGRVRNYYCPDCSEHFYYVPVPREERKEPARRVISLPTSCNLPIEKQNPEEGFGGKKWFDYWRERGFGSGVAKGESSSTRTNVPSRYLHSRRGKPPVGRPGRR